MEPRALRRRGLVGLVIIAVVGGATLWWRSRTPVGSAGVSSRPQTSPGVTRIVPAGTRIRVEVLNTTTVRGLGRRATMFLRDLGFDVVRFAGEGPVRESTLVLDRSGHPEWAELVGKSLGGARVESRPDSSRYVDVSVLIGTSWRPPTQPFYP